MIGDVEFNFFANPSKKKNELNSQFMTKNPLNSFT